MDVNHGSDLLAVVKDVQDLLVGEHELVLVGHKHLERVDAVLLGELLHVGLD